MRFDHVARFIVSAKESAVLSDAAAAEIKTEREPPRPRSDVQLISLPMMKKAILTRGSPLPDSLIAASERSRMYVCVPF
jgi:hypothetical protein